MTEKKIVCTAPVRVCDIGGWTDTWFAKYGAVFNIAVTPHVHVTLTTSPQDREERVELFLHNFDERYRLNPKHIPPYQRHPLIEAAIDIMDIPPNINVDIEIGSDMPSGASVGTSAAVCVALIGALDTLTTGLADAQQIAALAHRVETEKLGQQSGIQDQLCSAYGGIHYIDMYEFPHAHMIPVKTSPRFRRELEKRLSLIYIGSPHNSSDVHKMVIADLGEDASGDERMEQLRQLAGQAKDAVSDGNFKTLGQLMNQNTQVQRRLHPGLVCTAFEEVIEIASSFDVLGCKVNGAGGDGGSITILGNGDNRRQRDMLHELEKQGYISIPIRLSAPGVRTFVTENMNPGECE